MMIETERLYMRELTQADYGALCKILQDEETMYAYEGAMWKCRNGWNGKWPAITNGDLGCGR